MNKYYLLAATTALALAGCSSENDMTGGISTPPSDQQTPVTFSSYVGKDAKTRAGKTGVLNNTALQAAQESGGGFGVFGYYTDASDYNDNASTGSPCNFMWNQGVFYNSSTTSWEYSPLKFWPNETKSDGSSAIDGTNGATSTDGVDKLTFFAYAPFANTNKKDAGKYTGAFDPAATDGITSVSASSVKGDPKVNYTVVTDPAKSVDLCWAVANGTDSETYNTVTGTNNVITAGLPNINLIKQKTDEKVEFNFKHALSKVNFTVQASIDQATAGGTLPSATKITVENVKVENISFYKSGVLNLNNTVANTPLWENKTTTAWVLDDITGDKLNTTIKDSGTDKIQDVEGVTTTAPKSIFAASTSSFMLIPDEGKSFDITITYYVTTADERLSAGFSRIKNVIKKNITVTLEAGKDYTFNLVLGLTSVTVNATVTNWDAQTETPVYLPINVVTPTP